MVSPEAARRPAARCSGRPQEDFLVTIKFRLSFLALSATLVVPAQALANGAQKIGPVGNLVLSVVYGLVGIILLMVGYKIFEWVTPFSVNDALSKDQNRAVGIVVGAIFIGIAIIVAAALG
jgi:uncharacterized membrane protein YjfL (UPF0719 family)|tara:strand:+ start:253 stop:615 length:363 start_codon:yes stop_codon:yes gene_type:complete